MTGEHRFEQSRVDAISDELLNLYRNGKQRPRLTDCYPGFDLHTAYRVSEAVKVRRELRGDLCIGRKIGFTNFHMWEMYDVKAPIWGPMYRSTVTSLQESSVLSLTGLPSPKIEPEVVFWLGAVPRPGMSDRELLECVEAVALGFELVSSIFPDWRFTAPDAVAGFGVHAALITGSQVQISGDLGWIDQLSRFKVRLTCDGRRVAEGGGADVLGSPLSALRHLNDLLADREFGEPLRAGEVVTTGTLTLAMPVKPGENWTAEPEGIALAPITIEVK